MTNTYTQLYVQIVIAVKGRENLILERHRMELENYIREIATKKNCKVLAIYCNPDHSHILVELDSSISISNLIFYIKAYSSKYINENNWMPGVFDWQDGFGAFTYSKSQINDLSKYILNQQDHHKRKLFREEFITILRNSEIDYDEQFLFEWYD